MLVCRETDSLGCVNCVEKGWNKMENKVTVVLADANEEFRTMLRQRMEGTGEFHVAGSTENGDQALDLVRRLRPQLLVTDVVLPGLDGFGLLRQLNQLGQGAPRTIVVSSFCSRRTVAQAMEMGVYFFLPKPVNEESLLELMRQAAATLDYTPSEAELHEAVEQQIQTMEAQLAQRGLRLEDYCKFAGATPESLREDAKADAEQALRMQKAVDRIAILEGLRASQKDLDDAMQVIARENGLSLDQLKGYCDDNFNRAVENSVLSTKAYALVRALADVTEITVGGQK